MTEEPPKPGTLVLSVGEVAGVDTTTGATMTTTMTTTGKELRLASVAGADDMVYPWPLTVGKGSVKKGEDQHDQAVEILDTIRWVCEEQPELREMMGELLHSYNKTSWDSMNKLTTTFNESVKKLLTNEKTSGLAKSRLNQRPNRKLLKHILQQVYNTAIADPNDLNQYVAFTPEVYGETSFDLVCQMIDLISPITPEMKFIDLGSGVGQVVLQVAALVECRLCVGIEKAVIPATRAVEMDRLFKLWMNWYGKKYSPYALYQGDFLSPDHRKTISESMVVFVNNFAFGPEVDHHLKERFADLENGAKIVSSKPFCPLNFRITERNLSDIGTIMHVSVMDPLKGSVSWTDKPVSYYLHQIDTSKLERYFIRQQSHQEKGFRGRRHLLDDNASGSNSRASSLDPDSPNTLVSTNSGEDSDPTVGSKGKPRRGRPNKKKFTKKKSTPRPEPRVKKVTDYLKSLEVNMNGMDPTPDTSVTESGPNSRSESPSAVIEDVGAGASSGSGGAAAANGGSGRPVRAAVVTAAAISEAQNDILAKFDSSMEEGRMRKTAGSGAGRGRGKYKQMNDGVKLPRSSKVGPGAGGGGGAAKGRNKVANLDELDMLHKAAMTQIEHCNETSQLPSGCVDEKLNVMTPSQLIHHEIPLHVSHVTTPDGQQIPYGLHILLENMKKQYVKMVQQMQSKEYSDSIRDQIDKEKERKELLTKRVKQLENQIDNLIQDSLGLLKARLRELGISADTPTEFIEKAKGIVCSHNDYQKKKGSLEAEIRRLELDQENLITKKEKEILDAVLAQRSGSNPDNVVNIAELRNMVKSEIKACLDGRLPLAPPSSSPLPKVGSDVTLTKVPGPSSHGSARDQPVSTHGQPDKSKQETVSLPKVEMKFGAALEERARSETSDSQSFGKSKVMAAPRANDDYEDRFKKIITSELARPGDKEKGQGRVSLSPTKPEHDPRNNFMSQQRRPLGPGEMKHDPRHFDPRVQHDPRVMMTNGPPVPRNMPPMDPRFDPNQRGRPIDDPRGRPHDPRMINDGRPPGHDPRIFDPRSQDPRSLEIRQGPPPPPLDHPRGPPIDQRYPPGRFPEAGPMPREGLPRDRTFAQHISSEIERQMQAERGQKPAPAHPRPGSDRPPPFPAVSSGPPFPPVSSGPPFPSVSSGPPPPPASSTSSISSQGIMNMTVERAIQNSQSRLSKVIEDSVRKDVVTQEKKSIYAPNSRSTVPVTSGASGRPGDEAVIMEGLAMPRGNTSSPGDRKLPSSTSLPQVEGLAARFDSYFEKEKGTVPAGRTEGLAARFSSPDPAVSRPNSNSSRSSMSLNHDNNDQRQETGQENRKRPGSPAVSPVPGKRAASSSGGSAPDETKRCLDEINMGFDRLVAMASEVDKRRKSAGNSPQQTGSPKKSNSDLRINDASFDSNSLAAKFKAGLMQGSSQDKPSSSGPSFPGGNLPEHHFKKRYFNEEYQRQQQLETESRDRDVRPPDQPREREMRPQDPPRDREMRPQEHPPPPPMRPEMFDRSRAPGPPPHYGYDDRGRGYSDRGRGGYHHGPPGPRQMPPEHFRHGAPPGGPNYPRYPPDPQMMQMMYSNRPNMMYNRHPPPRHPQPPPK